VDSNLFEIFLYAAISVGITSTLLQFIITFYEIKFVSQPRSSNTSHELPPVSIMKPLKGLDDQLEENLRSFFTLDYLKYEIIFGVKESNDSALKIVLKISSDYPHVPIRIVADNRQTGLNPKVNNLANMYPHVTYDHILISDSNVRVKKDYLRRILPYLQMPQVGLVTCTIRGSGARRIGALMENLHLNGFIAASILTTQRLFKFPISVGKSMLMKGQVLEEIGGFAKFRNVLAEDHLINEALRARGYKVITTPCIIDNVNESWSTGRFISRHVRWGKMRKNIKLSGYLGEFFANPIFTGFLHLLFFFNVQSLILFMLVSLIKSAMDWAISRLLNSDLKFYQFGLIPVKDIIIGVVWFIPFFSRTVSWRGNHFRIFKNSQLSPLKSGGFDAAIDYQQQFVE